MTMSTILLESPSPDLLQPVVELARQLGIRIRRVEEDETTAPPIDREALERILDEGVEVAPSIKPKLSERFRGSITAEEAEAFNQYLRQSRDEWERPI
jgi:hypothetical protein